MDDLIAAYLEWAAEAGHSANTISSRSYMLYAIDRDLLVQGVPSGLEGANAAELRRWLGQYRSIRTRYHYRGHLEAFYRFATEEGYLDWSPMGKVPRYRCPPLAPHPAGDEHLARILTRAEQPYRLIAVLAAFAGLRCCEIAYLSRTHVTSAMLRVTGKGGRVDEIETHPAVWTEVSQFAGASPLVVQAGGRASPAWVSRATRRYLRERLGVPVTAHELRHQFVTGVLAATGNLVAAKEAARHSSVNSTIGYTKLVNGERRRGILALPVLTEATR